MELLKPCYILLTIALWSNSLSAQQSGTNYKNPNTKNKVALGNALVSNEKHPTTTTLKDLTPKMMPKDTKKTKGDYKHPYGLY